MRKALSAAIALAVFACSDSKPQADVYRLGFINPTLRDSVLAPMWSEGTVQNERAACVHFAQGATKPSWDGAVDSTYLVYALSDQQVGGVKDNPLVCGNGPSYHTHLNQTCMDDRSSCAIGGEYSNLCQPSKRDLATLSNSRAPFMLIQCDRRAFAFVWREQITQ